MFFFIDFNLCMSCQRNTIMTHLRESRVCTHSPHKRGEIREWKKLPEIYLNWQRLHAFNIPVQCTGLAWVNTNAFIRPSLSHIVDENEPRHDFYAIFGNSEYQSLTVFIPITVKRSLAPLVSWFVSRPFVLLRLCADRSQICCALIWLLI